MVYITYVEFIHNILNSGRERPKSVHDTLSGYENHHIIPKCMGGSNDRDNLIRLTYAEHLMAHILLFRENPHNNSLSHAVNLMSYVHNVYTLMSIVDNYDEFVECVKDISIAKEVMKTWWDDDKKMEQSKRMIGKKHSESTKQKMRDSWDSQRRKAYSERMTGVPLSDETKNKISKSNKGKKHSEESKKKISTARMGKYTGANNGHARAVICLETLHVFDTVKDATDYVNGAHVIDCCTGERDIAGGFHWRYYDEWISLSSDEQDLLMAKAQSTQYTPHRRSVICLETLEVFDTAVEAGKFIGCNERSISRCCKGKQKTCGGYHWMFYNEYLQKR